MKYFLALIPLLGVVFLFRGLRTGEIRDFDITQYEKAKIVGVLKNTTEQVSIQTSRGVSAKVFLSSINSISLRYQDEIANREIYHNYFIKSAEARLLRGKDLLFLKISGAYMNRLNEWYREEKIFLYNLSARNIIGWTKIGGDNE